jgi:hypothetical protein
VTVVILLAFVPTLVAQQLFQPRVVDVEEEERSAWRMQQRSGDTEPRAWSDRDDGSGIREASTMSPLVASSGRECLAVPRSFAPSRIDLVTADLRGLPRVHLVCTRMGRRA